MNYESIEIVFKYIIKHPENLELFKESIGSIDSNELYKYVSLLNNDNIISYLLNNSSKLYEKFMNNDQRAIRYINDRLVNIKIIEYPEYLKNNNIIFESLKTDSIVDFRNNIEKYSSINKVYSIQEKLEKYEDTLIQAFDPNTCSFNIPNLETDRYMHAVYLPEIAQKKFNELIIDKLFRDNYNNVVLNIKELLRYKKDNITEENLKLYNSIINFKNLSYEEKINIYNTYKDKKLYTTFYLETLECRKELYNDIKNNLYKPNIKNEELSKKYNIDIYYLDGEDFSMIVRSLSSQYREQKQYSFLNRECFSLITEDNTSVLSREFVYGYTEFNPENILSMNEDDAFSINSGQTNYVNRLMNSSELTSTAGINEIQIKIDSTTLKPSYVVAFNEIKDTDVFESQRLNIPIVLINEEKYNKKELKQSNILTDREKYVDSSYFENEGHRL